MRVKSIMTPLLKTILYSFNIYVTPPITPNGVSNTFTQKSHILCDRTIIMKNPIMSMKILTDITQYYPSISRKSVHFIDLPSLYDLDEGSDDSYRDLNKDIHIPNTFSHSHRLRYEELVKHSNWVISYERYCHLESRLASIIEAYSKDRQLSWFMMTDPLNMYGDGIPMYFSKQTNSDIVYVSRTVDNGCTNLVVWSDQTSSQI